MPNSSPPDEKSAAPWASGPAPGNRHLLRRSLPWLVLALLVSLVVWGLWPKPVMVETGVIARSPLTVRVSEEGKTRIRNRYVVAAPVGGMMQRVVLRPGDEVKANETVITRIVPQTAPLIDPRARIQAQEAVSMHKANRKRAVESQAALKIAANLAAVERDRAFAIKQRGAVSALDLDRVEAEATAKAAELRAAEFALQVIDHELAQALAVLEQPASGATDPVVEIKSPVTGKVLTVMQESETMMNPGQPIIEVGDPADIEIEAEILSRDAVMIEAGDEVLIEQWGGAEALKGRVRRVEPAAFTKISALGVEEQRVIVLIDLQAADGKAKALGDRFRVEVRVAVWHADDVLVSPAGALFREGNQWKTFVMRDGRARLTPVEVGHSDGRFSQIISGLAVGDKVLLHPPDTVADGSAVSSLLR
ncbi:MAG: HlyD family efflux transporter periplasmic adaptor subunit [Verrucomicrobia bacterium]|nr:HlyD family efflux transporter periplasmic adaptor subunit [Verrucomicrobiota bacterium]